MATPPRSAPRNAADIIYLFQEKSRSEIYKYCKEVLGITSINSKARKSLCLLKIAEHYKIECQLSDFETIKRGKNVETKIPVPENTKKISHILILPQINFTNPSKIAEYELIIKKLGKQIPKNLKWKETICITKNSSPENFTEQVEKLISKLYRYCGAGVFVFTEKIPNSIFAGSFIPTEKILEFENIKVLSNSISDTLIQKDFDEPPERKLIINHISESNIQTITFCNPYSYIKISGETKNEILEKIKSSTHLLPHLKIFSPQHLSDSDIPTFYSTLQIDLAPENFPAYDDPELELKKWKIENISIDSSTIVSTEKIITTELDIAKIVKHTIFSEVREINRAVKNKILEPKKYTIKISSPKSTFTVEVDAKQTDSTKKIIYPDRTTPKKILPPEISLELLLITTNLPKISLLDNLCTSQNFDELIVERKKIDPDSSKILQQQILHTKLQIENFANKLLPDQQVKITESIIIENFANLDKPTKLLINLILHIAISTHSKKITPKCFLIESSVDENIIRHISEHAEKIIIYKSSE